MIEGKVFDIRVSAYAEKHKHKAKYGGYSVEHSDYADIFLP